MKELLGGTWQVLVEWLHRYTWWWQILVHLGAGRSGWTPGEVTVGFWTISDAQRTLSLKHITFGCQRWCRRDRCWDRWPLWLDKGTDVKHIPPEALDHSGASLTSLRSIWPQERQGFWHFRHRLPLCMWLMCAHQLYQNFQNEQETKWLTCHRWRCWVHRFTSVVNPNKSPFWYKFTLQKNARLLFVFFVKRGSSSSWGRRK